jgi:hypothetical protein
MRMHGRLCCINLAMCVCSCQCWLARQTDSWSLCGYIYIYIYICIYRLMELYMIVSKKLVGKRDNYFFLFRFRTLSFDHVWIRRVCVHVYVCMYTYLPGSIMFERWEYVCMYMHMYVCIHYLVASWLNQERVCMCVCMYVYILTW